jgi:hypothetical protein
MDFGFPIYNFLLCLMGLAGVDGFRLTVRFGRNHQAVHLKGARP